jgi:short-subunit dehydrogenase involved in D-alanine esterification of teichoic acids
MLTKVNVIANIHLFNLLIPLIRKGKGKKVITLTTGYADLDITIKHDVEVCPFYAGSKAHMNLIVGKFSAQYKQEGILFLSLSPGAVDTGRS